MNPKYLSRTTNGQTLPFELLGSIGTQAITGKPYAVIRAMKAEPSPDGKRWIITSDPRGERITIVARQPFDWVDDRGRFYAWEAKPVQMPPPPDPTPLFAMEAKDAFRLARSMYRDGMRRRAEVTPNGLVRPKCRAATIIANSLHPNGAEALQPYRKEELVNVALQLVRKARGGYRRIDGIRIYEPPSLSLHVVALQEARRQLRNGFLTKTYTSDSY